MENNERKNYSSPKLNVIYVNLEHSLAASSITVSSGNSSNVVNDQWETDADDNRTINW